MSTPRTGPELPGMVCIEKLGSGGFSDVYLYEQQHPRLKVAVKLLKSDVLDEGQRRQFAAEADVMAELAEHPYIVPVLDAGTAPDGRPYLAMRYFPPPDLGARVAKEQLTVPVALRTGIQLASAVETAHRSGIIHRDIKPANVLVSSYGVPALSDFGIAGRGDRTEDDATLGVSMPWSPPEVLNGKSNGSAASDVYSLAATVWHLLVGRSPFSAPGDNSERAMFSRILHGKPPTIGRADAPTSLDRLLQQAMAKDPSHRPRSALEFARHLQRVEQELRLTRTEIVVLETDEVIASDPRLSSTTAPPDSAGTVAPANPAPVDSGDDGVTLMRRPVTIRPSAPSRPHFPEAGGPGADGPSADGPAAAASEVTERRRPPASAVAASTAELTELRPAVVAPSPPPAEPAAGKFKRGLIPALIGLVAAVGVALAAILATTGGDEPQPPSSSEGGPSEAGDVVDGLAEDVALTPNDVRLSVHQTTAALVFTAKGTSGASGLQWSAKTGSTAYERVESSSARVVVQMTQPGQACVRLQQVHDGQLIDLGEKCGRWR